MLILFPPNSFEKFFVSKSFRQGGSLKLDMLGQGNVSNLKEFVLMNLFVEKETCWLHHSTG
jgi:hypothetical protein